MQQCLKLIYQRRKKATIIGFIGRGVVPSKFIVNKAYEINQKKKY